jgi:hypothetical protein
MRLLLQVRMGGKGAVYANGLTGFEVSEGMTMTMTWTRGLSTPTRPPHMRFL